MIQNPNLSLSLSIAFSMSSAELMVPPFSFFVTMQSMYELEFEGVQ